MPGMHTIEPEGDVRIDLYVRDELPPPARKQSETIYDRLQRLEREGAIAEFVAGEWPRRTPLQGADDHLRDTYLAFTGWATGTEFELTPFFEVRECYAPGERERTDWLVVPAICLSVTVEDTLEVVYPHTSTAGTRTVEAGLDWVETCLLEYRTQPKASAD